ncbi:UNVERIFIED_CONTAM: hypothetical protein FKN15_036954 [Acipenser sinensis]
MTKQRQTMMKTCGKVSYAAQQEANHLQREAFQVHRERWERLLSAEPQGEAPSSPNPAQEKELPAQEQEFPVHSSEFSVQRSEFPVQRSELPTLEFCLIIANFITHLTHPTPPIPTALSSDAAALGGCMVSLQCEKKRSADGTCFGGQRVLVFATPESVQGW